MISVNLAEGAPAEDGKRFHNSLFVFFFFSIPGQGLTSIVAALNTFCTLAGVRIDSANVARCHGRTDIVSILESTISPAFFSPLLRHHACTICRLWHCTMRWVTVLA